MSLGRGTRIAAALALGLTLAACSRGGESQGGAAGTSKGSGEPYVVTFATGAPDAVFGVIGAGVADVVNRNNPDIRVAMQASAGSVENLRLLGTKQVVMGFAAADALYAAYNGEREFSEGAYKHLRAVISTYPNALHFAVHKDSKIRSPKDLRGKTVSVGAPGSLPRSIVTTLMQKYYGMKGGSDYKEQSLSTADALAAVGDKQVDAAFIALGLPGAAVTAAMLSGNIRLARIDPDVLDKAVTDFPYWTKAEIAKDTYGGMPEGVPTVFVQTIVTLRGDVPEDVAYKITKTLLEHTEDLAKVHSVGKSFTLANALKGVSVPFHPGAKRYLEEKGVKVP